MYVHHVPKCMSCHKAVMVITRRAHCFHDCTYILHTSCFVRFEHSVCRDHLWSLIYHYLSICLSIYLSIYLPTYLSICLPTYLPIYLSIYLSTCLSVYLSIYLPTYLAMYLLNYLSICLCIYLPISVNIAEAN